MRGWPMAFAGLILSGPLLAQPVVLTSGVARSFTIPAVNGLTLLTGSNRFQITVPSDATQLEVRLTVPSGPQWAIGVRAGTDFSTTTFNNQWGGTVGQNPVVITRTSNPALAGGTYFIGILVVTNSSAVQASITATVTSTSPSISAPSSLIWGNVTVGQSQDQTLRVQNTGTGSLTIHSISIINAQFRAVGPATPIVIPASGAQDLTFRFQPATTGPHTGTLTIASNDPVRPNLVLTIGGTGVAAVVPVISTTNGIVNGASFLSGIASGSWFTIRGTNLATTTRIWNGADFQGDRLPIVLDGVSVKVNNRDAFVYFISPTQINALAPLDTATGPVNVTVSNSLGTSLSVSATYQQYAPGLFAFDPQNRIYPAAVHPDGSFVGRAGLFGSAAVTVPARPGGRISLYATGLGATTPAADPAVILTAAAPLVTPNTLRVLVNNIAATVEFVGMVSNGLYQVNIVVPDVPDGDQTLILEIGGVRSQSTMRLTILRPPAPSIGYPGRTLQSSLNCPGLRCVSTVTVSPGEQTDFWITGANLAGTSEIRFLPADGITVNIVQSTSASVQAILTIASGAPLGKRRFTVVSPLGESNQSAGTLNISNFRISNLRVQNIANSGTTLTFTAIVDYTDPTGAVSSGSLDIFHAITFGNTVVLGFGSVTPSGRVPGATSGVFTIDRSYTNVRGTTGAVFDIRLVAPDGRESDNLEQAF